MWIGYPELHEDRKHLLDSLGFYHSPRFKAVTAWTASQWEMHFKVLVDFKELNGHCFVPPDHSLVML